MAAISIVNHDSSRLLYVYLIYVYLYLYSWLELYEGVMIVVKIWGSLKNRSVRVECCERLSEYELGKNVYKHWFTKKKKNVDNIKIKMVQEQNKDDGLDSPTNKYEF